ncbi:MAG: cupin domain-containing protein [Xanthomonadales bacterium]|nr:cupin domain-containing protein [Xanthomonadales bacterium]
MSRPYSTIGGCKVIEADSLDLQRQHNVLWTRVFGEPQGATALSLFYLQCEAGETPHLGFGESEAVFYLLEGRARVVISGTAIDVHQGCGIHVREGETCGFVGAADRVTRWLAVVCPQCAEIGFNEQPRGTFDQRHPERVVDGARSTSHSTADRYYKLLVGPSVGSRSITQFIGKIPKSRAPEHFHLYEEVIYILSGHGRMWAGEHAAEVGPGSMIFLPRKQRHSLECLHENGMELVGMFYPAGSPAVSYES